MRTGRIKGTYRKVHIPHDENFYEQDYFEPGDEGFKVFDTRFGKIGVLICYDQWFPEAARSIALMGAGIIFYPTAIGTVRGIRRRRGTGKRRGKTSMRGHAIANGLVVAAANRVGNEGQMDFWGASFVVDAFGRTLVRGGRKDCTNHHKGRSWTWEESSRGLAILLNRRPECYSKLVEQKDIEKSK